MFCVRSGNGLIVSSHDIHFVLMLIEGRGRQVNVVVVQSS